MYAAPGPRYLRWRSLKLTEEYAEMIGPNANVIKGCDPTREIEPLSDLIRKWYFADS